VNAREEATFIIGCGWIDVVGTGMKFCGQCMDSTGLNDSVLDGMKTKTAYKELEHF
jgi:hypothetical protein